MFGGASKQAMRIALWPTGGLPPWRRGLPFFPAEPRSAVERLRSVGSRQVWTRGPIWKRLALGSAMALGWPIATFFDALMLSAKREKWGGRGGFLATFGTLYRAALTRNIPPNQYAVHVSLGVSPNELPDYLMPLDLRALHNLSIERGAVPTVVQHKARFAETCRAHGLTCVPTLATFEHGTSTGEDVLSKLREPLFVKALTGNRGAGANLWRPSDRGFVSSNGQELTADELIEWLRTQNCIVQPVLTDHPALQALGTVALSNLRLVTAKAPQTAAVPIAASLSLAVEPDSLTGHAGIHCGIDISSGRITGTSKSVEEDDRLVGRDLVGFTMPHWSECIGIACQAHDEAFPAFTTLGWDLVVTSNGPVLLETNVNWRIMGHQKLTGPLGLALADVIDASLLPVQADRPEAGPPAKRASRLPLPALQGDRAHAGAKGRKRRPPAAKAS